MIKLDIDLLVIDKGTQAREEINRTQVSQYVEDLENGAEFTPIYVIFDGLSYYLADGFHRYHAHRQAGRKTINADVDNGTLDDASLYATSANKDHGLPRTNADKRKAVLITINNPRSMGWTDQAVADWVGVSRSFVNNIRGDKKNEQITYKTTSGKEVTRSAKTKKTKPEVVKKEIVGAMPPEVKDDPVYDPAKDAMLEIAKENEQLKDRLAVEVMDASEEEKTMAADTIAELREEVRKLQIINTSLVISRDQFQNENAQLKKQVAVLQRKLKQYE